MISGKVPIPKEINHHLSPCQYLNFARKIPKDRILNKVNLTYPFPSPEYDRFAIPEYFQRYRVINTTLLAIEVYLPLGLGICSLN